jgi:uncharacterized membrane protein (UPF0127 family)
MAAAAMSTPPTIVKVLMALLLAGVAAGAFLAMRGCEQARLPTNPGDRVPVVIAGQKFELEPALEDSVRILGLGKREVIEPRGGMIFVFPYSDVLGFVMRDCPIAIDIAFLDDAGRVLAMHEMTPEAPQRADEDGMAYENRLKRYSSRYPSRFVVEVAGGTLRKLGLKEGDRVEFDAEGLKRRVK